MNVSQGTSQLDASMEHSNPASGRDQPDRRLSSYRQRYQPDEEEIKKEQILQLTQYFSAEFLKEAAKDKGVILQKLFNLCVKESPVVAPRNR